MVFAPDRSRRIHKNLIFCSYGVKAVGIQQSQSLYQGENSNKEKIRTCFFSLLAKAGPSPGPISFPGFVSRRMGADNPLSSIFIAPVISRCTSHSLVAK